MPELISRAQERPLGCPADGRLDLGGGFHPRGVAEEVELGLIAGAALPAWIDRHHQAGDADQYSGEPDQPDERPGIAELRGRPLRRKRAAQYGADADAGCRQQDRRLAICPRKFLARFGQLGGANLARELFCLEIDLDYATSVRFFLPAKMASENSEP